MSQTEIILTFVLFNNTDNNDNISNNYKKRERNEVFYAFFVTV